MNRKLINGLLIAVASCAAVGSFTSCKDEVTDERIERIAADENLQAQINELNSLITNCKNECHNKMEDLLGEILGLKDADASNKAELEQKITDLAAEINNRIDNLPQGGGISADEIAQIIEEALTSETNGIKVTIEELIEDVITGDNENINETINALIDARLQQFAQQIADYAEEFSALHGSVDRLQNNVEALQNLVEALKARIEDLENGTTPPTCDCPDEATIRTWIAEALTAIQTDLTALQGTVNGILGDVAQAKLDIAANTAANAANAAEIAAQAAKITDHETRLTNMKNEIDSLQTSLQNQINSLTSQIAQLNIDIANINTNINNINNNINNLTNTVNGKQDIITDLADIRAAVAKVGTLEWINLYKTTIETLSGTLSAIDNRIGACEGNIATNAANIATLRNDLGDLEDSVDLIRTEINTLSQTITNNYNTLDGKIGLLDSKIDQVDSSLRTLINEYDLAIGLRLDALDQFTTENREAIEALQARVDSLFGQLENRLNKLITSIVNQGTHNPLFGKASLPIGIESNILINYSGVSDSPNFVFPTDRQMNIAYDSDYILSDADLRVINAAGNVKTEYIANGQTLFNPYDEAHPDYMCLGKVYTTINPNNVNFAGQTLPLVDSRDNAAPIELKLRKSNELLDFGLTRAGNNNGFYEADAIMPATRENIAKMNIHIDASLKQAAKDLLKERNRSTIFGMVRAVYDQLNGFLPAYGLKAAWEANGKEYAVYSKYEFAVCTFRPLSYGFFYDKHINTHLPIIDPFGEAFLNLDPSKYKFSIPNVDLSGVRTTLDFQFSEFNLTYEGNLQLDGFVTVNGKTEPIHGEVDPNDLDDFVQSIKNQINSKVGDWQQSLDQAFENAIRDLANQIQADVNSMLADMEADINGTIKDMITDIQDEVNNRVGDYLNKFDSFIDKYNKLAAKVNDIIKYPNAYLQLTMIYNTGSGYHHVSTNPAHPTTFRHAGGDGMMLYPTTHNAEILTPAYRKFIACTNVWKGTNAKGSVNAQSGNADCLAKANALNHGAGMNQVFKGSQRRFALPASKSELASGYTYELTYVGVDYHGVTSTAKFYITVK